MASFDLLKKVKVDGKSTATYVFWDLDGAPELVCRPATKQNKKFYAAMLGNESVKRLIMGSHASDKDIKAAEDTLGNLYADHVIVSWTNMGEITDADGEKCNRANKKAFILSLSIFAFTLYNMLSPFTLKVYHINTLYVLYI